MSNRYDCAVADPRTSRRARAVSRHGREFRGPLLPPTVPGWRSRAERFDMAVLEAYEPIERRWRQRLSELDVPYVAVGDRVNVRFDALPGRVVAGEVTEIATMSTYALGEVVYQVTVELEETAELPLRWGMTASIDLDVE